MHKIRLTTAALALALAFVATAGLAAEKPRIAVLEFKAKAAHDWYSWWSNQGAGAAQDVFVTELVKSGKFRVIEREQLAAIMQEKGLALSGDLDPSTAMRVGKLLGVKYMLAGAVTEFGTSTAGVNTGRVRGIPGVGIKRKKFACAMNARLFDVETGEIVWADEARQETNSAKVRVGGFGGGVDDNAQFDRVLKPTVKELVASLRAADI